jgi:para-aminobenzoate synthetase/4-amino-4-deoxychorismate lyase
VILLDDAQSTDQRRTSRLYGLPCDHWRITQTKDIHACLTAIESALQKGRYVATAFSYECGEFLQGLTPKPSSTPLIEAFAFEDVTYLSRQEVDQWIQNSLLQASDHNEAGVMNLAPSLTPDEFAKKIAAIHRLIESGDTYQVNHTFQYSGQIYGDALRLYARLRQRQPSLFGAFFQGAEQTLLSVSPEWFISCTNGELVSKPMKGTLSAEQHQLTDLAADSKNRTENLMIVDLIRNDLGRISEIGSVTVPAMFEVEKFGNLMQMKL